MKTKTLLLLFVYIDADRFKSKCDSFLFGCGGTGRPASDNNRMNAEWNGNFW